MTVYLIRRFALVYGGVLISLVMSYTVNAATIIVNSTSDTSSEDACVLRDAVNSLNMSTLQGGCDNTGSAFGDNDTINFALPSPFTIELDNGPLQITTDMLIISGLGGLVGAGQAIIRPAEGAASRVFVVSDARFELLNFTVSGGFVEDNNFPDEQSLGGGIYATNGAQLRLLVCIIENNRADVGGGIGLDSSSSATISGSVIRNNSAVAGAGVGAVDSSRVYLLGESVIEDNSANDLGGGVGIRTSSRLTVRSNSRIVNNQAFVDTSMFAGMGTVFPDATLGGGISAQENSVVQISENSVIDGNTAVLGGGIYVSNSELNVEDSQISNNLSEGVNSVFDDFVTFRRGFGGGIHNDSALAVLRNADIHNNSARLGGGIFARGSSLSVGSLVVSQSLLANNIAQNSGGGLYFGGNQVGGLVNSTVSGNLAGDDASAGVSPAGGGLYAFNGNNLQLLHNTFSENTASNGSGGGLYLNNTPAFLFNNLIAGNNGSFGSEFFDTDGSLNFSSRGNLIGDASKTFDEAASFPPFLLFPTASEVIATSTLQGGGENPNPFNLDQIIQPLADSGGLSYMPASNSPALDAGYRPSCTNFNIVEDQLGQPRNDGRCDIGSIEVDQTACYVIKALNGNVVTFCL